MDNQKINERGEKMIGGYTAFVLALLILLLNQSNSSKLVVSLLFISLPSLAAMFSIDFIVRVKQGRNISILRGLSFFLGFMPSIIAILLVIKNFSWIAMIVFAILIIFWLIAIQELAFWGKEKDSSL